MQCVINKLQLCTGSKAATRTREQKAKRTRGRACKKRVAKDGVWAFDRSPLVAELLVGCSRGL
jgi:hypothetical protein